MTIRTYGNYVVQTIYRANGRIAAEAWFHSEADAFRYGCRVGREPDQYIRILTLDGELAWTEDMNLSLAHTR
jgi:hypothetical protein